MIRWHFLDLDTSEGYTFPRNPRAMTAPTVPNRTKAFVGHRATGFRQGRIPTAFSFQGKTVTKAEYDALLDWSTRRRIHLTDHRGRVLEIIPQAFDPTPRRSGRHDISWVFDYTFKALLVGRIQ